MRFHLKILPLLLIVLLGACVKIPDADYKKPKIIPESAHPAPMMFSKLKVELPVGSDVGYYSDFGLDETSWFLIPANQQMLRKGISTKELGAVFSGVMEGMGYDVADYLDPIFDEEIENEILRAEYRIGGRIIDAKMDLDRESYDNFGTIFFGQEGVRGTLYLKIQWSVYNTLRRATVYQTVTEGKGTLKHTDPDGMTLMINAAFDMAAHNLGADEGFYNLLVKGQKPDNWPRRKKYEDRPLKYDSREEVNIPARTLSKTPFKHMNEQAQKAAVLVQGSTGHGSGFFITEQGHILTNQHVVGNAQRVRVVTSGKDKKLIAQVLRIDRARDAALLKLEEIPSDLDFEILPIRTDWPDISEEIYAIGAPKTPRLQGTVSKGIISAHRPKYKLIGTRQDFIQGDVPIHGGNSGGPLLDAHGNIVGISVIGLYMHEGKRSADLNLFIPIGDALKKLDISLDDKKAADYPEKPNSDKSKKSPINLLD